MNIGWTGVGVAAAALLGWASIATGAPRMSAGEPTPSKQLLPLGRMIELAGRSGLHIVYVHGMRADKSGSSAEMMAAIAKWMEVAPPADPTTGTLIPLNLGKRPADATVAGCHIWNGDRKGDPCGKFNSADAELAWAKSQPFIHRFILDNGRQRVVIDELNWWPLLMGLRCKFLVAPEHDLSGNDRHAITMCSKDEEHYYPWISPGEADDMLSTRPASGGGVKINGSLKRSIMNWGMADAVIAVGPMRTYFNATVEQAIARAGGTSPTEHALVTESLGSFLVLDAMRESSTREFIASASNLIFFANQFALLELGRIENLGTPPATEPLVEPAQPASPLSPLEMLQKLARGREALAAPKPLQILAISDPSDALTYRIPKLEGILVSNVFVKVSGGPFGLLADPRRAHRGAVRTPAIWADILGPRPSKAR